MSNREDVIRRVDVPLAVDEVQLGLDDAVDVVDLIEPLSNRDDLRLDVAEADDVGAHRVDAVDVVLQVTDQAMEESQIVGDVAVLVDVPVEADDDGVDLVVERLDSGLDAIQPSELGQQVFPCALNLGQGHQEGRVAVVEPLEDGVLVLRRELLDRVEDRRQEGDGHALSGLPV